MDGSLAKIDCNTSIQRLKEQHKRQIQRHLEIFQSEKRMNELQMGKMESTKRALEEELARTHQEYEQKEARYQEEVESLMEQIEEQSRQQSHRKAPVMADSETQVIAPGTNDSAT